MITDEMLFLLRRNPNFSGESALAYQIADRLEALEKYRYDITKYIDLLYELTLSAVESGALIDDRLGAGWADCMSDLLLKTLDKMKEANVIDY